MSPSPPPQVSRAEYARRCCEYGMSLLSTRRLDEAMAEFYDALRVAPACADAHFGIGECLAVRGRLDDATAHYLKCLQVSPGHAASRFGLGNIYQARGNVDEALAQYAQAQKADPAHVPARFKLGKCLEMKGQIGDALATYRSISQKFPDFIDAYLAAAQCLVGLGRAAEAIGEYRKAIALAPERIDLRELLIDLLVREGLINAAIAEYRALLTHTPRDLETHLRIAHLMDQGGQIVEAIGEYDIALKIDPHNSFARIKRQILAREREKIDGLTDRYLGHVIGRAGPIGARFHEGIKLYGIGRFEQAAEELKAEIGGKHGTEACFALGACAVRAGRLLEAASFFREAARLRADFPEAHTMLGIIYERHGIMSEAYKEYELGVLEARDQALRDRSSKGAADSRQADQMYRFLLL